MANVMLGTTADGRVFLVEVKRESKSLGEVQRTGPKCSTARKEQKRRKAKREKLNVCEAAYPVLSQATLDDFSLKMELGRIEPESTMADDGASVQVTLADFPTAAKSTLSSSGSKRSRVRLPKTGEFVGYAKTLREATTDKREAIEAEDEKKVAKTALDAQMCAKCNFTKSEREMGAPEAYHQIQPDVPISGKSVGNLREEIISAAEANEKVTCMSLNLKGQYVRELREAAKLVCLNTAELGDSRSRGTCPT